MAIKFIMDRTDREEDRRFSTINESYPSKIMMQMEDGATLQDLQREFLNFCKAMGYVIDPFTVVELDDSENPDKRRIRDLEEELFILKGETKKRWDFPVVKNKEEADKLACEDCQCCGECEDE